MNMLCFSQPTSYWYDYMVNDMHCILTHFMRARLCACTHTPGRAHCCFSMKSDHRSYILSLHRHYCISRASGDRTADTPSNKITAHTIGAIVRVHILAIIDQLRRWPDTREAILNAGITISSITELCSATIPAAMLIVPDCDTLIRPTRAARLDVYDRYGYDHGSER